MEYHGQRARLTRYDVRPTEVEMAARILVLLALLLVAGWGPCEAHVTDRTDSMTPASLTDRSWVFTADRTAWGEKELPSDQYAEDDYVPLPAAEIYDVVVSDHGNRISTHRVPSIGTLPLTGRRSRSTPERIEFEITQVAGGRFVFWIADHTLQAELTTYGLPALA